MVKYEATGLVFYTDTTPPKEIHGFVFLSDRPSTGFQYEISSFFLSWNGFIFDGTEGFFRFKYWENHGMDGDAMESLMLQKSGTGVVGSGSETVIMERELIQDPSDFVLPNALRYNCGLANINAGFDYAELWFHQVCMPGTGKHGKGK